jgi:hypothetical protein
MAIFRIKHSVPCYVTDFYEIEAKNVQEAKEKFCRGDHGGIACDPAIGNKIETLSTVEEFDLISGEEEETDE